ncbi:uncharacterized protein LOC121929547 isoform X2 [Sceloporus undulatus]|uniref:uncharacterized protein LOC121929547 isoform X2 n=1 Tax=Sceloporus undulatus TaxID=8520 RepID=UPI001C4B1A3A|nr:uncharacterized protein LOC121929547 isoform X2 [Sceloporus undulatus]
MWSSSSSSWPSFLLPRLRGLEEGEARAAWTHPGRKPPSQPCPMECKSPELLLKAKKNTWQSHPFLAFPRDEVSQVLHAADGISMAVGSIADVKDCSAEEEKEHLLKEDVQTEAPKTELSPWNRLINMYKQRRRLPAPKSHHQDISAQPLIEGETTLDLMVFGIAASKDHVPLTKPCGAGSAYGVPENEAGEIAGDCEITQRNLGLNDAESLEHPKNVY